MRTTKRTLISVAALVVMACFFATGCDAASDNLDAKAAAGCWTIKTDNGSSTFIMKLCDDGTGFTGA